MNQVSDTIMELDRGHIRFFPGNYQAYTELKEQQLKEEEDSFFVPRFLPCRLNWIVILHYILSHRRNSNL